MRKEMARCVGLSAEKLKNDEFWKRRIKFSKNLMKKCSQLLGMDLE